jgi:HAD superfamily hydrolase (TIGR01458 family)
VSPVEGLLLDIDGVLAVSWEPIPGAMETLAWLRREHVPFRLITNTTTHTRRRLAETLAAGGVHVAPDEVVTAIVATAEYLRGHRPGAKAFVLSDGDPGEDLEGVPVVDAPEDADVVVLGGAGDGFSYDALNRVFRRLMDGAPLIGMHRNLYWRTSNGWELDAGAYINGLEAASGVSATICGKPAGAFFTAALDLLGVPAERAAMVGDDITNDVVGAQAAGIRGVLVRTGKFRPEDLSTGSPDVVLDSIARLPSWLRTGATA